MFVSKELLTKSLNLPTGYRAVGTVTGFTPHENTFILHTEEEALELVFLSDGIVRVRLGPDGSFPPFFSYALDPNRAWEGPNRLDVHRNNGTISIQTDLFEVRITCDPCRLAFYTPADQLLQRDADGAVWTDGETDAPRVACSKFLQPQERLYGLGDKPRRLNLRGASLTNWNSDAFMFQRNADPLYKSFPFLLSLNEELAYGLFFDNTFRHTFDLGTGDADTMVYEAEGGDLCYYFIHADSPLEIIRQYTLLTGRPSMLPKWSLGYHQCRYSYFPESDVRAVAAEFRTREIPCDVLYFDIHYMDGYRVFTWDLEGFPDPDQLLEDLQTDGFQSVVIIDPGVKVDDDYFVAQQGLDQDVFCRYPNGELFVGEVWPGACYFPDFTDPRVRTWWGSLFKDLIDQGVAGIWCDMNEPSVFTVPGSEIQAGTMPLHIRHDYDGHPTDHRQAHNVYGMQMVRAVYDGLRDLQPHRRPFIITRAAYAGTQRYSTGWTGDNSSRWDHLLLSLQQCLSLNVCGMSFVGSDVGGFSEEPDGELLARWTQLGAFTPLFRNHSAVDVPRQEVWLFGDEVEQICKTYIELRYQLLPYFYTVLYEAATQGLPMLRALPVMHPTDQTILRTEPKAFYFGENLLIHPVTEPGQTSQLVYLPEGTWYEFWTGALLEGRSSRLVATPLDFMPIHVKAGTVLPMQPVMQYTGERPVDTLTLHVYPCEGSFSSTLFEDAGDGWGFTRGTYYLCTFEGHASEQEIRLDARVDGTFRPDWTTWAIELHGVRQVPSSVTSANEPVAFEYEPGTLRFEIQPDAGFVVRY